MSLRMIWLLLPLGALLSCNETARKDSDIVGESADTSAIVMDEMLEEEWIFRRNGKISNAPVFEDLYQKTSLDTFDFPFISSDLVQVLAQQEKLLRI